MQGQTTNNTAYIERLPMPSLYTLGGGGSSTSYNIARFYRTASNANVVITIPIGADYSPNLWYSEDTTLPMATLNDIATTLDVDIMDGCYARINTSGKYQHNLRIEYKLTKNIGGDGFKNMRKIQCLFIKDDGTAYNLANAGYQQPGSSNRMTMDIVDIIDHTANDKIKMRFTVVQDNAFTDHTDTYLTIYNIIWTIVGTPN